MTNLSGVGKVGALGEIGGIAGDQLARVAARSQSQQVQEEFMAMFYKEILKQAFKTPDFNVTDQEDNGGFTKVFTSDLMVGQLAMQLAKSQAFKGFADR